MADSKPLIIALSAKAKYPPLASWGAHQWSVEELLKIKARLNKSKKLMDAVGDRDKFDTFNDNQRGVNTLRGYRGVLVENYNAQVVTNAWLKLYEILHFIYTHRIATGKVDEDDKPIKVGAAEMPAGKFLSFHFAEAPGNFILALNHYLAVAEPTQEWSWMANSLRRLYSGDRSRPLDDKYGLIGKNRDKWKWGAECDGDITSPANIRSFAQDVNDVWGPKAGAHLVTADVKYVPSGGFNWDEEEAFNVPVQAGQILCSLFTLAKGGSAILKEFTLFEAASVSLTWLFVCCFDNVWIVKPVASRPSNSEIYLTGTGFKNNLTDEQRESLLKYIKELRVWWSAEDYSVPPPALFKKTDIPADFIDKLVRIGRTLAERQTVALESLIAKWNKKEETSADILKKEADAWIAFNKIKPLPANRRINLTP